MQRPDRPNVLVIHADQHRHDCLGACGNDAIRTPNLDRLAHEGMIYTNHFCSYPVCTPSRYSLLCGRPVRRHHGWDNRSTLAPGIETFPRIMRRAGYRTDAVGKMHFTPTYLDVGFSRMRLAEQDGPGRFEDDYHEYLMQHGLLDRVDLYDQRGEYRAGAEDAYWESFGALPSDLPLERHSTSYITAAAEEVISGWAGGGNLLMVGYVKPHHPFDPPEPYASLYRPDELQPLPGYTPVVPEQDRAATHAYFDNGRLTPDALRRVMAMYYGTITHIDDGVGRLVAALKARGLYDHTIIVYTSDHGEYLGYHHLLLKGYRMYDPLVKVPLIVKSVDGSHGVCSGLGSNTDVAAYLLSRCGLQVAAGMADGGLGSDEPGRECVVAEQLVSADGAVEYMLRTRRHKLLLSGSLEHARVYDLESDPFELRDLSDDPSSQAVRAELVRLLTREVLFDSRPVAYRDARAPTVVARSEGELRQRREAVRTWHARETGIAPDE